MGGIVELFVVILVWVNGIFEVIVVCRVKFNVLCVLYVMVVGTVCVGVVGSVEFICILCFTLIVCVWIICIIGWVKCIWIVCGGFCIVVGVVFVE